MRTAASAPPADPYAAAGVERVSLTGPAGEPVAVVTPLERHGRPWADLVWAPPGTATAATARALLETFALAHTAVEDPGLVDALAHAGATVVRDATGYTRDLRADPPPPDWSAGAGIPAGAVLERLDERLGRERATEIVRVQLTAFQPPHPDHALAEQLATEASLGKLVAGDLLGPLLRGATLGRAGTAGAVIGALLLTDRGGVPPLGGPWVTDVFRDPDPRWAGLGAALLRRGLALSARDGLPAVGLVVSSGNPARRVYERLGFRSTGRSWSLRLPGPTARGLSAPCWWHVASWVRARPPALRAGHRRCLRRPGPSLRRAGQPRPGPLHPVLPAAGTAGPGLPDPVGRDAG